ncbi:MAG: hypothetical protein HZC18_01570 [Candidatus Omnitrophica bacterium]|nr:hypothetical protein [Candidatus Omnitrophota bacterium]
MPLTTTSSIRWARNPVALFIKGITLLFNSLRQKGTDLHPQILVSDLKKLPIKNLPFQDQKPFLVLVERILALTRTNDYEKNLEKQSKVKGFQCQIDQTVYKLYGLTEEEIKIVEGDSSAQNTSELVKTRFDKAGSV